MAQNYTNEMRFALFTNDKRGNEKRPDFRGTLSIDGIEYKMSGWLRTTKDGKNLQYIAGQIEKADPKQAGGGTASPAAFPRPAAAPAAPAQTATTMNDTQDGDIPF